MAPIESVCTSPASQAAGAGLASQAPHAAHAHGVLVQPREVIVPASQDAHRRSMTHTPPRPTPAGRRVTASRSGGCQPAVRTANACRWPARWRCAPGEPLRGHGLDVDPLPTGPGEPQGHRRDPKERARAAGFDEEARHAGPHHGGRLHGHRRQAGVRAKLRVRTEIEHEGEEIDYHECAAEPGDPKDAGIRPGVATHTAVAP